MGWNHRFSFVTLRLFYGCSYRFHLSGDNSRDRCIKGLLLGSVTPVLFLVPLPRKPNMARVLVCPRPPTHTMTTGAWGLLCIRVSPVSPDRSPSHCACACTGTDAICNGPFARHQVDDLASCQARCQVLVDEGQLVNSPDYVHGNGTALASWHDETTAGANGGPVWASRCTCGTASDSGDHKTYCEEVRVG